MSAEQMPVPRAKTADFSPQAVSRAVLNATLQKPYVLYPTAVGVLGGLAAVVLGPSLLFLAPAAAGLTLGVGLMLTSTLVNNMFQGRSFVLTLIDGGHWALALVIESVVIALLA